MTTRDPFTVTAATVNSSGPQAHKAGGHCTPTSEGLPNRSLDVRSPCRSVSGPGGWVSRFPAQSPRAGPSSRYREGGGSDDPHGWTPPFSTRELTAKRLPPSTKLAGRLPVLLESQETLPIAVGRARGDLTLSPDKPSRTTQRSRIILPGRGSPRSCGDPRQGSAGISGCDPGR